MSFNFIIPLPLLETLQLAFEKEAKKLAEDVAKSLGLSKQEVIKLVLKKTNLKVIEWEQPPGCSILQHTNSIHIRCGRPCLLGTEKCSIHQKESDYEPEIKMPLRKIIIDKDSFWVYEETGAIYNTHGEKLGWMKHGEAYFISYNG
jgi:hypothetical protein